MSDTSFESTCSPSTSRLLVSPPTDTSTPTKLSSTRPPTSALGRMVPPPSGTALRIEPPQHDPSGWQVVLRKPQEGKVVLYHAKLNELSVRDAFHYQDNSEAGPSRASTSSSNSNSSAEVGLELISSNTNNGLGQPRRRTPERVRTCPLCMQPLPRTPQGSGPGAVPPQASAWPSSSYFQLLSTANTPRTSYTSQAATPASARPEAELNSATINDGYYAAFFDELQLLGRGGQGSVYLAAHVLNGERLGMYAVKKVAVGNSAASLIRILREVRLLEQVQHPNIISYHHAWVEHARLSAFGPPTPTLYVLMSWANGGSLQSWINQRRGGAAGGGADEAGLSRAERVKKFRERNLGVVHLLRIDEILGLFEDVVQGLGWLHGRNVLHLDLKAENVLLQWDEDALLPVAKLSDFGNATNDASHRERTGMSGTLDWTPPEAFVPEVRTGKLPAPDRATDQWALGLILHLLSFFTLPYHNEADNDLLEQEIRAYKGFFPPDALSLDHGTRHDVPQALLRLMARLVNVVPASRISCDKVLHEVRIIRDEGLEANATRDASALVASPPAVFPSPGLTPRPSSELIRRLSPPGVRPSSFAPPQALEPPELDKRTWQLDRKAQAQTVAGVLAMLKAYSLTRVCGTRAPLASQAVWLVLLPTVVEFVVLDCRLSAVLMGLHVVLLMAGVGMGVGGRHGSGPCYGVAAGVAKA